MKILKLVQPENDSIGAQIKELFSILETINKSREDEEILIDISEVKRVYPLQILPITVLINQLIAQNKSLTVRQPQNQNLLNSIKFYEGFNMELFSDWKVEIANYNNKKNLPLFMIPTGFINKNLTKPESLLSEICNIFVKQMNLKAKFKDTIYYLLFEAIGNICDHAKVNHGWLMLQKSVNKKYFDICVCDNGISILGSYVQNNVSGIKTDEKAIQNAIIGKSTKMYSKSRGFGISTTREMIVKGLNGEYFLFSGSAFYLQSENFEQICTLPKQYRWNGTIVVMRIPLILPEDFDLYKYVG